MLIHPLLDADRQKKARRYEKEKRILRLIGSAQSLGLLLVFYLSGLSAWLADLIPGASQIPVFLVYMLVFITGQALLGLPLSFVSGYRHEHKWGFSNQTIKAWLWDQTKAFGVSLLLGILLLGSIFWIMDAVPSLWWLIAGLAGAGVGVILATLFPVLILPLFNTYTPIENGELTEVLDQTLKRGGLRSSGFFMEDMSRQTKKENAFLAGLGRTRRVVLGDNLIANMSVKEIESIIAHEVGHFKHKHIWKSILFGSFQQIFLFYLADVIMRSIFPQFLTSLRWNLTLFPCLVLLVGGVSGVVFGPLGNAVSRAFERQADRYALESIEDVLPFQTALAGLAGRNLANAYPEWWIKALYYSHPPIGERLAAASSGNSLTGEER